MRWDSIWYIDGRRSEELSYVNQSWEGGETGENWFVCITSDSPLVDGLYELALAFDGVLLLTDALFIGDDHDPATVTIENRSQGIICEMNLSPTGAQQWGGSDLGADDVEPSTTKTIEIPSGTYDLQLVDCNGQVLDERSGLDVEGSYEVVFPAE